MCVCVYVYIFNHCYFSLTKVPSGADVFFLSLNGPCRQCSATTPTPSLSLAFTCEWTLWNCKHCRVLLRGSCLWVSGPQVAVAWQHWQPSSTRPPHLIWRFFTVLHIYRLSFIIECVAIRFGFAIELLFNLNRWHVRFAAGGQYKAGNKCKISTF